jgi:hypothetical protein
MSYSPIGNEAFRWTEDSGMIGLGDLDGGSYFSRAYGVSADGPVELLNVLFSQFKELQAEMDDPIDVTEAFDNFMNNVPPPKL